MAAMIKAIFFTRFLEKQGTRVIHQVPPGSIVPCDQVGTGRRNNNTNTHHSPSHRQHPHHDSGPAHDPSRGEDALSEPLLDFASISDYLIPRWPFCDQAVSIRVSPRLRVLGHPVCIEDDGRYGRGRFLFNLAVVVVSPMNGSGPAEDGDGDGDDVDWDREDGEDGEDDQEQDRGRGREYPNKQRRPRKQQRPTTSPVACDRKRTNDVPGDLIAVISKLARLLRGLEELSGFLSREDHEPVGYNGAYGDTFIGPGSSSDGAFKYQGRVHALCEMIMEDLNNYSECMIPIDDANTVNLKLFPPRPPPPTYLPSTIVPVLTTNLPFETITTDLTVRRLLPHLKAGIHPLGEISVMSGIHLSLIRKAVQHLLYYDCIILMEMPFSFSAIYGATPNFPIFVNDWIGLEECARYVMADDRWIAGGGERGGGGQSLGKQSFSQNTERYDAEGVDTSRYPDPLSSTTTLPQPSPSLPFLQSSKLPSSSTLIRLYSSLVHPRRPVREWVQAHLKVLFQHGIDPRRFVIFGLLHGFLYCVRKWAVVVEEPMKSAASVIAFAEGGFDGNGNGGMGMGMGMGMGRGDGGGVPSGSIRADLGPGSVTGPIQRAPQRRTLSSSSGVRLNMDRPAGGKEDTSRLGVGGSSLKVLYDGRSTSLSPSPTPSASRSPSSSAASIVSSMKGDTGMGLHSTGTEPSTTTAPLTNSEDGPDTSSISGGVVPIPAGGISVAAAAVAAAAAAAAGSGTTSTPSALSTLMARYNNLVGTHPVDRLCARWAMSEKDVIWWLTRQQNGNTHSQQGQQQQQQQQQFQSGGVGGLGAGGGAAGSSSVGGIGGLVAGREQAGLNVNSNVLDDDDGQGAGQHNQNLNQQDGGGVGVGVGVGGGGGDVAAGINTIGTGAGRKVVFVYR